MFQTTPKGTETYVGTVTNTDDPEKRGRILVTCPALLGDDTRELPGWVEPALPMGWFLIPDVGRQVAISISGGSENDLIAGQSSISSGASWNAELYTTEQGDNPTPDEFKTNYGKRRGFKTPRGHVFFFDDSAGKEQVTLSWVGGTKAEPKNALISLDKAGSFVAQDSAGSVIYLNGSNGETSVVNSSGAYLTMSDDGIALVDTNNNAIVMNSSGISLVSAGPITFAGSDHIFQNGLHFADDGLTVNVGGIVSSFHPATVNGVAMTTTTTANVAVPGEPTWLDQLVALNVTALL